MILARYFFKRFFTNVFFINISFTLLFNLIEFFEKMVRVKDAPTSAILYFIGLNLIPSFFENLPVSSWLGSCMTLAQMEQQNEWEILKLLNIKTKKILFFVLISGITLVAFNFFGKEFLTNKLAISAEKFKHEKFKQDRQKKLFNQWFALNEKTFSHFKYLDLHKNKGDGLSLIEISPKFKIQKITSAKKFSIDHNDKNIVIPDGITLFTKTQEQKTLVNKNIKLPSFFTQLKMQGETPSLNQMFHVVIFDKKVLPNHVYHQLLYLFLSRILIHLLLIIYPLLTFLLFFLFPYHRFYRWILIFLPYPLAIFLFTSTDSLIRFLQYGTLATIPYITLFLAIFFVYNSIRK